MTKELSDGTQIPDRMYYYMLDFLDKHDKLQYLSVYNITRVSELNAKQFAELFNKITTLDLELL